MLKYILIILLNFNTVLANEANQKKKIKQTKAIIEKLMPFIQKNSNEGLKVKGCKFDQGKWIMLLISKQPFQEKISFNKNCDLKGEYTAKMESPFPVSFLLQNLENFNQVDFKFIIKLVYKPVALIKIKMIDGIIKGKDTARYELEYSAQIDPLSKNFIKKDLGGQLTIKTINSKKINQKIKLKNGR